MAILVAFALLWLAPAARATPLDFGRIGTVACSGSVSSLTGGNFSTTGIRVTSPDFGSERFNLTFNTRTGAISLVGSAGDTLSGRIASFFANTNFGLTTIDFTAVNWTHLTSGVVAALGSAQGNGVGIVIELSSRRAVSVDVPVTPVPEPGTLGLFGASLTFIGGIVRRKFCSWYRGTEQQE